MTHNARLALSLVIEPGDARMRDLLVDHKPEEIVRALRGRTGLPGVRLPDAWRERAANLDDQVARVLSRAEQAQMRWICPGDRDWPAQLDDLNHVSPLQASAGAPLGLWVRGTGSLAALCVRSVGLVGARECTTYGAECASELAADLADAGWTVVSGAAYGIDACAHRGALSLGKPTVAVLACGADVDYPKSHTALLHRIAEDGLVVSEQVPGVGPRKQRFLSRNRIIAALSAGTVVVEAALRSGSLNTLNWADQLGRVTMGVPGPVTSKASGGVHACLRDGRAILVTSGAEVIEELSGIGAPPAPRDVASTEFDRLPTTLRATLEGLQWRQARTLLELADETRLAARDVRDALVLLERQGLACRQGIGWVLARRADTA